VGVKEDIDVHAAGLALGLRLVYEDADKSSEGIKEWPVCVRKDTLSDPAMLKPFLRALAASCAAVQLNEALPFELGVFCRWWFKPSKTRNAAILNECICRNLDEAFFPDKSSPSIEAQGLRVLADIFTSLRSSGHSGKNPQAEELLVALFERMSRGFGLLFRVLCWHKALTHPAAVFVQRRLLEAIGAVHSPQQKNKKTKQYCKHFECATAGVASHRQDQACNPQCTSVSPELWCHEGRVPAPVAARTLSSTFTFWSPHKMCILAVMLTGRTAQ